MDKLSEQVRKMVGEWRKEVAERNRIGVGPSGGMAFAYQRCADALETLLPQIEALEQRQVKVTRTVRPSFQVEDDDSGQQEREREDALIQECNIVWLEEVRKYLYDDFDLAELVEAVRERLARKEQKSK